jgi:hypothetical protein
MCLSLSLFSVPVSMAVVVQGVSPRVLGVITTLSTSNVCFSLFLIYTLDSAFYYMGSYLEVPKFWIHLSVPNVWNQ